MDRGFAATVGNQFVVVVEVQSLQCVWCCRVAENVSKKEADVIRLEAELKRTKLQIQSLENTVEQKVCSSLFITLFLFCAL